MKITLIALAAVSTALLFWFCKHTRYTADNLPTQQLRFGNGGGFTGKETVFVLLENGQIFSKSLDGALTEVAKVKSKKAKEQFDTATKLGLNMLNFQHPGNMYYFLEVPAADGKTNRVTWGDNNAPIPTEIKDFYQQLMGLVKKD